MAPKNGLRDARFHAFPGRSVREVTLFVPRLGCG